MNSSNFTECINYTTYFRSPLLVISLTISLGSEAMRKPVWSGYVHYEITATPSSYNEDAPSDHYQ